MDRSAFSTTVKAGDAFKTRTYPEQVNFKDDDGDWTAIDRSLEPQSDGSVRPAAIDGDAVIPSTLTKPVVLEHDGRSVSFRLLGADPGADREVSGTKASFDDALSGVDVSYKVRPNGLKELIKLSSRSSRRSFSYDVRSDADLTAAIEGRDVVFKDAAGTERFRVAAPIAWDSAEPKEATNALTLSVVKSADRQWRMTMRADDAWLDDPARVYPVTLDPDYFYMDGYTRFHGANQDCELAGGSLAGQSRCGLDLQIGYGNNRPYKSVMKFSDITGAIPAYATATAARFLAWQFPNNTAKANVSSRLRTVTRDWDNTATWDVAKTGTAWTTKGGDTSTDPNLTGPPITVGPSGYWSYWPAPLTTVNGWIKGTVPNYGFQISTETTYPNVVNAYGFTSTEGNQDSWPALEVTWMPDTVAPPAPDDLWINSYDPGATVQTASFTWNTMPDPALSNGAPGSGVATRQARYRINGGAFTSWTTVMTDDLTVTNVQQGQTFDVEVRSIDAAGNVSPAATLNFPLGSAIVNGVVDRPEVSDDLTPDPTGGPVQNNPANDEPVGSSFPEPADPVATLTATQSSGTARAADLSRRWNISIQGGWVTVRNNRQQFVIGSGKNGWQFDSIKGDGNPNTGYLWGYLYGGTKYRYCGWINSEGLGDDNKDNPGDRCSSLDHIPISRFAALINCDQCNGGTNAKLIAPATGWRNIRPWARPNYVKSDAAIYYKAGENVRWRYVTPDNEWVLIGDGDIKSGANWAFVPRGSFGYMNLGVAGMCKAQDKGTPRETMAPSHKGWPNVCTIHG